FACPGVLAVLQQSPGFLVVRMKARNRRELELSAARLKTVSDTYRVVLVVALLDDGDDFLEPTFIRTRNLRPTHIGEVHGGEYQYRPAHQFAHRSGLPFGPRPRKGGIFPRQGIVVGISLPREG